MAIIRVLHVFGKLDVGGAESRIMDIYRQIDRNQVQFDFLVHSNEIGKFEEEIAGLGGFVYRLPERKIRNILKYIVACCILFRNHQEFTAIHAHSLSSAIVYLSIAKLYRNKNIIIHSRCGRSADTDILTTIKEISKRSSSFLASSRFAVSEEAAFAAFGKRAVLKGKVQILPNAIDTRKYLFNQITREKVREDLGLSDKLVVGHIGRFSTQKNHEFLLKVFSEIVLLEPNSVLLLVGKGELEESIKNKCSDLGIEDKVRFLGVRSDVPDLLQAMDVIVFPSFYEGLPGVILEAQAAGLPCVISDKITREARITDLVEYLSISISAKEWAEVVLKKVETTERRVTLNEFIDAGFDIEAVAKWYQEFYLGQV